MAAPEDLSPSAVFARVSTGVFVVAALRSDGVAQGSAVVIARGLVVTNRHVVEGASQIRVLQQGNTWQATTVKIDTDHDLAELTVPDLPADPLAMRTSQDLQVGERVYAIGAPLALELTLSEGLISSLRPYQAGHVIQTTVAVSPGSSGGGLFDSQGRLIGITTFKWKDGENLNFALPLEWALSINGQTGRVVPGWNAPATGSVGPSQSESDVDRMRREGGEQFERIVALLARKAGEMDVAWRRYADSCLGKYTVGYAYGRDWFGLWDSSIAIPNESTPQCLTISSDVSRLSEEIHRGMAAAEEGARQSWVYPGVRSAIRQKYYMDWSGWDH